MKMLEWTKWMAVGCLAAAGCATDMDSPDGRGSQDGTYRYVLGFDEETGITHFGGAHEVVVITERGKEEAIDAPNMPSRLHPALSSTTNMTYDPAVTTGKSDWNVFASNWWPQTSNGIAFRWDGGSQDFSSHGDTSKLSPIEKYDVLFHPGQTVQVAQVEHHDYADINRPEAERGDKHKHEAVTAIGPATAWELQNHGVYQDWVHPENWWGHCNGWASYATTEPLGFPQRDVWVKLVDGKVTECTGETAGCVLFKMGDIEALFSELYFSDQATFAGRRCNTNPDEIERDEHGRPTDPACRDLNPGSFHVALVGLLGRGAKHLGTNQEMKLPFVLDTSYDWEVWNFPVNEFEIEEQEIVTRERAAELVAEISDYVWNANARKFVRVKLSFEVISDGVPWAQMKLRADQRNVAPHRTTVDYVLELDDNDKILGGEWIKNPSWSWGEKKIAADFMWAATKVNGFGEDADDLGGNNDNPHLAYSHARALLQCANDPSTCAPVTEPGPGPGPQPGPDSCVEACGGNAGNCWCDDACSNYGDCCADYQPVCTADQPDPEPEPEPTALSCQGHCGTSDPVTSGDSKCYCDSLCTDYGDCCGDYANVCN